MKSFLSAAAVLAAISVLGTPARAQNYPWCAQYSGGALGGAMNCGFISFHQCLATVRGIGGFCVRNTLYRPPADRIAGARPEESGAFTRPNEVAAFRPESASHFLGHQASAPIPLCQRRDHAA
jgi:hypothetical protein